MASQIPLSVILLVKNEEKKIEECLKSIHGWADEIILVDDFSSDKTVEIARRYTDKIFQRGMDKYGTQANWAFAQVENEWILSLNGHETVTDELKKEIAVILPIDTEHAAFDIPIRNYIGDYWLRYGGWYPASKVRLFRKDKFKYEEVEVHPRAFLNGKCGHLHSDIIHKGYPDIEHFVSSVNRQSTLEAIKWINSGRKMSLGRIIWRTVDRFFRRFLRKKAYKDGIYGLVISYCDSLYQILSYVKYLEMKNKRQLDNTLTPD